MQQYKIHINFQALLLSIQVPEQGKSEKEIAFRKMGEDCKKRKISDVCVCCNFCLCGVISFTKLVISCYQ